ncbi:hypothetical protein BZA05DRAFT_422426 [Tricharina praecox]|uniref:uncharacterized protein n=1 Tax=Tricharina praecox TaxID=43433 RepID=UPI002220F7DB|nr:uncharacterized protein BZA05DRAFT_422426 [Tricharina praecox]KAI5842787.1 hypothetical protein BZA05DRAFT_422426 [Tricharina praecox]
MQINLCILPILSTIAAVVSAAPSGILPRSGSVSATSINTVNEPADKYHMIEFPHFEIPGIDDAITNPEHKHDPAPVIYPDPSCNSTFNYYTSAGEIGKLVCETSWASPTYDEIDYVVWKVSKQKKNTCGQENHTGSKCTRLQRYKGGELSLCGRGGWAIPCPAVAWAGKEIRNRFTLNAEVFLPPRKRSVLRDLELGVIVVISDMCCENLVEGVNMSTPRLAHSSKKSLTTKQQIGNVELLLLSVPAESSTVTEASDVYEIQGEAVKSANWGRRENSKKGRKKRGAEISKRETPGSLNDMPDSHGYQHGTQYDDEYFAQQVYDQCLISVYNGRLEIT